MDFATHDDVIDLSHPMTPEMPNFPSAPAFNLIPYYRLGDFELPNGYWGCNEAVAMSGHSGTHLDALGHVAQNGELYGGVPVADAQDGITGLVRHSIEEVGPIVRRGVFFDVAGFLGVDCLEPGQAVDAELLERIATERSIELKPGDCVLVRTGWQRYWTTDPQAYIGSDGGVPGIDITAAHWLGDRGAYLIGADTGTVEMTAVGVFELPVHLEALTQRGIYLLENVALDDLAADGRTEFLFVCTPLKLRGSSGSPVRPVAVFG